jgi:mono/diheme cytochrome c family protein
MVTSLRDFPYHSRCKLRTRTLYFFIAFIVVAAMGCTQERAENFPQGQELYQTYCVACHGAQGGGVLYNKSVLNNDPFVRGDPEEVIAVILYGREGAGTMPSWEMTLNDEKVAAVVTYIRQAWSNRADPVTAAMVTKVKNARKKSSSKNPTP